MKKLPIIRLAALLFFAFVSANSGAQEIRYSWLDLSYMAQDFDRMGSQVPIPGQLVDIDGQDGDGVRFRGSMGLWNNLYLFLDYGSTDIDVNAVITNSQGTFLAEDKFDYTTIRGGVGLRIPVAFSTDLYAEASYDSLDLDLGSFALENFDMNEKDIGATVGVRHMFNDDIEVRAYGRYTNVGDVNLNTLAFDSDTLFGAGIGWTLIRGFSIQADYESGEFSSWSFGFRLDLDEDR